LAVKVISPCCCYFYSNLLIYVLNHVSLTTLTVYLYFILKFTNARPQLSVSHNTANNCQYNKPIRHLGLLSIQ